MRAKPVKKISLWGLYVHGEKGGKQEDTKPGLNQAWELVFENPNLNSGSKTTISKYKKKPGSETRT